MVLALELVCRPANKKAGINTGLYVLLILASVYVTCHMNCNMTRDTA